MPLRTAPTPPLHWSVANFLRRLRFGFREQEEPATIFVAGMARSGTTWVAELINFDNQRQLIFEPFFPQMVPEASCFERIQYMRPEHKHVARAAQARRILSGHVGNAWTDRYGVPVPGSKLIVKDIRCNLMLGWLKALCPKMPIVLVMRHPLAIAASLLRLGWTAPRPGGERTNFQMIISQPALLADFPILSRILSQIDRNDLFEQILFQWGVYHLVPFSQCGTGDLFPVQYEALVLNPEGELQNLFQFLRLPFDWNRLSQAVERPSLTNCLKRDPETDREHLLAGWKTELSDQQIQRAKEILSLFGWDPSGTGEYLGAPARNELGRAGSANNYLPRGHAPAGQALS